VVRAIGTELLTVRIDLYARELRERACGSLAEGAAARRGAARRHPSAGRVKPV